MKSILTLLLGLFLVFTYFDMAYSTNDDLLSAMDEAEVIELIDDEEIARESIAELVSIADDPGHEYKQIASRQLERIDRARANGDELINTYLRPHISLPLDPVPDAITEISVDMTIYNLYKRRFRADMPEGIRASYKQNINTLLEFRKGGQQLTDKPNVSAGQMKTNRRHSDRLFRG